MSDRRTFLTLLAAAGLASMTACSGTGGSAQRLGKQLLPMPRVHTGNGLVIDGEPIADAATYAAAREEGKVLFYTASGKEGEKLTTARFEAETGLVVEMVRMPASRLAERILSEAGADKLSAQVIRITEPQSAEEFVERDVFAPYRPPSYPRLRSERHAVFPGDRYYTAYYSAYAFGYNSDVVRPQQAPRSWWDVLDPRWRGKFGVVQVGAGGTAAALAHFQIDTLGVDYLRRLGKQQGRIFDTTSVQIDAMARGEVPVCTLGFNNGLAAQLQGAPIRMVVPPEGVSGSYNVMGLTHTGIASAAARVFMNWTMSGPGQQFAAAQGFVPARTDTPTTPAGEYVLPKANTREFQLFTPEDSDRYAERDEKLWSDAFDYIA